MTWPDVWRCSRFCPLHSSSALQLVIHCQNCLIFDPYLRITNNVQLNFFVVFIMLPFTRFRWFRLILKYFLTMYYYYFIFFFWHDKNKSASFARKCQAISILVGFLKTKQHHFVDCTIRNPAVALHLNELEHQHHKQLYQMCLQGKRVRYFFFPKCMNIVNE